MVVDDAAVVRKSAAHLLSEAGYDVFEAGSAAEALAILSSRQPVDLMLTDVVMPDVNGAELAREVRRRWPSVHVVFMSAHSAEVLRREGVGHPDVMFLAKPFTRDELLNLVDAILES